MGSGNIVLGLLDDIADAARTAGCIAFKDVRPHSLAEEAVFIDISDTGRTDDCDSTTVGVEEHALTAGQRCVIKAGELTSCSKEYRQVLVVQQVLDIRTHQQALARPVLCTGVANVVPPQDALVQRGVHLVARIGVVARTAVAHVGKGVDKDVVINHVFTTVGTGRGNHALGVFHVVTIILIVGNKHDLVLP